MHKIIAAAVLLAAVSSLAGCGNYVLQGKVIEGPYAAIMMVNEDDDRLERPGVGDAQINIFRDPDSLGKKLVASDRADPEGYLSVEIAEFGTGWLDEQWLVQVWRSGFASVDQLVRMPSSKKRRILVTIPTGRSVTPVQPEDLFKLPEQYR